MLKKIQISKLVPILFLLLNIPLYSQEYSIELKSQSPDYKAITEVKLGDILWDENSNSEAEYGIQYRLVITSFEIYESLYIDKFVTDIEGIVTRIEWTKKADTDSLLEYLNLSDEQSNISSIKWIEYNLFNLTIGQVELFAKIIGDNELILNRK